MLLINREYNHGVKLSIQKDLTVRLTFPFPNMNLAKDVQNLFLTKTHHCPMITNEGFVFEHNYLGAAYFASEIMNVFEKHVVELLDSKDYPYVRDEFYSSGLDHSFDKYLEEWNTMGTGILNDTILNQAAIAREAFKSRLRAQVSYSWETDPEVAEQVYNRHLEVYDEASAYVPIDMEVNTSLRYQQENHKELFEGPGAAISIVIEEKIVSLSIEELTRLLKEIRRDNKYYLNWTMRDGVRRIEVIAIVKGLPQDQNLEDLPELADLFAVFKSFAK